MKCIELLFRNWGRFYTCDWQLYRDLCVCEIHTFFPSLVCLCVCARVFFLHCSALKVQQHRWGYRACHYYGGECWWVCAALCGPCVRADKPRQRQHKAFNGNGILIVAPLLLCEPWWCCECRVKHYPLVRWDDSNGFSLWGNMMKDLCYWLIHLQTPLMDLTQSKNKGATMKCSVKACKSCICIVTTIWYFMVEMGEIQWYGKSCRERVGSWRDVMERDEGGGAGKCVCMHFQGGLSVARKKNSSLRGKRTGSSWWRYANVIQRRKLTLETFMWRRRLQGCVWF